jgi:hypothetical protein
MSDQLVINLADHRGIVAKAALTRQPPAPLLPALVPELERELAAVRSGLIAVDRVAYFPDALAAAAAYKLAMQPAEHAVIETWVVNLLGFLPVGPNTPPMETTIHGILLACGHLPPSCFTMPDPAQPGVSTLEQALRAFPFWPGPGAVAKLLQPILDRMKRDHWTLVCCARAGVKAQPISGTARAVPRPPPPQNVSTARTCDNNDTADKWRKADADAYASRDAQLAVLLGHGGHTQ